MTELELITGLALGGALVVALVQMGTYRRWRREVTKVDAMRKAHNDARIAVLDANQTTVESLKPIVAYAERFCSFELLRCIRRTTEATGMVTKAVMEPRHEEFGP